MEKREKETSAPTSPAGIPPQADDSPAKPAIVDPKEELRLLKNQFDQYFAAFQHYVRLGDYVKLFLWILVAALAVGNTLSVQEPVEFSIKVDRALVPFLTPIILFVGWMVLVYIESKASMNAQWLEFLIYRINSLFPEERPPMEYTLTYARFAKKIKHDPQETVESFYWSVNLIVYLAAVIIATSCPLEANCPVWKVWFGLGACLGLGFLWWLSDISKVYHKDFREAWVLYFAAQGYRLPDLPEPDTSRAG